MELKNTSLRAMWKNKVLEVLKVGNSFPGNRVKATVMVNLGCQLDWIGNQQMVFWVCLEVISQQY